MHLTWYMHDADSHISYLVQRLNDNAITEKEFDELLKLAGDGHEAEFISVLQRAAANETPTELTAEQVDKMWQKIREQEAPVVPVHRVHFLRTAWFRYAAAIIVIVGIGAYLWNIQTKEKPSVTQTSPIPLQNDVAPGGNKAVLTLADGSHIILDSAASGQLAREANATITKTGDGRIEYQADEKPGNRVLFNTMSTPRGGQYQLTLPDGSRVWLNAESSITYPTAFTGSERRVSITGEAYFEVAKDRTKPFFVTCQAGPPTLRASAAEGEGGLNQRREGSAQRALTIEVLGTHFNINAYSNENQIKTSLLEGSVKIENSILKPGQAYINGRVVATNTEQDVAWKNGFFNLEDVTLEQAMRQFARWYDIDIVYDKGIPNEKLSGEMDRFLTLRDALLGLEGVVAHFRLEGRTVHVTPL